MKSPYAGLWYTYFSAFQTMAALAAKAGHCRQQLCNSQLAQAEFVDSSLANASPSVSVSEAHAGIPVKEAEEPYCKRHL